MSTAHWIQTIVEIALATFLIVALYKQDSWAPRFDRWQKDIRRRMVAAGDAFFEVQPEPMRILTAKEKATQGAATPKGDL